VENGMPELDGQLAIVTQASSHLARPLAGALAQGGARLALVDHDLETAAALAVQMRGVGAEATAYACGVSAQQVASALEAIVAGQGRPEILVNCPAPLAVSPSAETSEAEFRAALDGCLVHAFLWCRAAGRVMLAAGSGVIVNVSGLPGMGGWPGWIAASAALGGLHNLTHTLASEWSRYGVRTNCLVPGVTEPMVELLLQTPEAPDRATVLERIPLGRLATGEDLGKALIYLVRPAASYISGEILRVDGAWDVWGRYYAVDPHASKASPTPQAGR
jgi:NAD(P)-dependent dehydrogenase (short-subunit alcohol dehydrogenase family)